MRAALRACVALLLLLTFAACSRAPQLSPLPPDGVVLAFGDSLTSGAGTATDAAYPARLTTLIRRTVVNAGMPGETTTEALSRLPAVLAEHRPRLVLLCLGGNDMLQQQPAARIQANLRLLIQTVRASGAELVLIGVPEPRLLGGTPDWYARLAEEYRLPYEGDILSEVLKDNRLKSDPIHPNAAGYDAIAKRLAQLLKESGAL